MEKATEICLVSGGHLLDAYHQAPQKVKHHIANLMQEHLIVAAIIEGITVDELTDKHRKDRL